MGSLLPPAGNCVTRPLAQEILAHLPGETRRGPEPPPPTNDDAELEAVLASLKTNIKVVGCGGGGCNTINRLAEEGLSGADMIACNTDAQHLLGDPRSQEDPARPAPHPGTRGRGASPGRRAGRPRGRGRAQEGARELRHGLHHPRARRRDGTGPAPVVAQCAKDASGGNPLTIAVCTLPFASEGLVRAGERDVGARAAPRDVIDTVITIPNDRLLELVPAPPDPDRLQGRRLGPRPCHPRDHGDHHPPGPRQPRLQRPPNDHEGRRGRPDRHRGVREREPGRGRRPRGDQLARSSASTSRGPPARSSTSPAGRT